MRKLLLILSLLALFGLSACGPKQASAPGPTPPPPPASKDAQQTYYDFDDIPVPKDMKLLPKKSIVFESPTLKAGVVYFEGRVDAVSLFNYYVNTMPQENWSLRSYFKYGQYILVFEKPTKDCIIHIQDGPLTTEMQIWVTPRLAPDSDVPSAKPIK
ncbi:MAG: hypothetical protein Q9M37_04355 [Desulfonauticus sp.]|nr:hypothetical protein [Desulfonauticus sp.]